MSRAKKLGWISLALAAGVILLVPFGNFWRRTPLRVSGPWSGSDFEPVSRLLQQACSDCHTRDLDRLPWYARLGWVEPLIQRDRDAAQHGWPLERAQLTGQSQWADSDLAELEGALQESSMPPRLYGLAHFNTRLRANDRQRVLAWIRGVRARAPAAKSMAPALRGEPIQPLILPSALDPAKLALGERLFHDRRLSVDDSTSCATCHDLRRGGTDRAKVSTGVRRQHGSINAPTVFNASYNVLEFWDGRARDLAEQAAGPLQNPVEMGSDWATVIEKLGHDDGYQAQFSRIYPGEGIAPRTIADALAGFEESLITVDSPFDRYLMGEQYAVGQDEKAGYVLFKELGCTTCHFGPAVGGRSLQVMGRKRDYFGDRGRQTEADLGRFRVTHDERDRHVFKVPTLRNVALTLPYFHDGSTSSLMEAVNTMARYQLDRDLSAEQAGNLVKFLESLTGKYRGKSLGRP